MELISINQAATQGIERIRKEIWAIPEDHLKIDIIDLGDGTKELRLWSEFYSPMNLSCNGEDPVKILLPQLDCEALEWEPYSGFLPTSNEYAEKREYFNKAIRAKVVLQKGRQ